MNESNQKSTKAFFFLRHNNDIDHITPVIHKWLSNENIPTDIIITTDREHLTDYRIEFLKQHKNANIYYIDDLFKKQSLEHFFNKYYFKYNTQADNYIKKSNFAKKFADKRIKKVTEKLFKGVDRGIVVFDWTSTYFVQQVIKIAKKRKFISISLPHGDAPYVNQLITSGAMNYKFMDAHASAKIFDYLVVPNQLCYKRYDKYLDKNKIKILGSPRYSDEWMDIVLKMIPPYKVDESKNKLKIVLFLRNMGYPIFWEEVVRSIKFILQFPNVYLIVQHHPRNTRAKKLTKRLINIYPELKTEIDVNVKFNYKGVNSVSLLKWADLIIDVGTSITWDAVKQGKPVLMPEYLHANYSTVAYYIKASEIKDKDQFIEIIESFVKNKNRKFYDEKDRQRFIKEIIDVPDKKILERYTKFLKGCLNESGKK